MRTTTMVATLVEAARRVYGLIRWYAKPPVGHGSDGSSTEPYVTWRASVSPSSAPAAALAESVSGPGSGTNTERL